MGWIATGCCTVIAGYVLYTYFARATVQGGSKDAARLENGHVSKSSVEVKEQSPPPPQIVREEHPRALPAVGTASPPSMQLTEPEVGDMPAKAADKPPRKSEASSTLAMPPPPPKLNRPSSPPRLKPSSASSLAPPPRPGNGFVRPPPSAAASLRVPATKVLPNASLAPTSSIMPPGKQVSRKVILEPGHSPLDWAALTNNPTSNLRGKDAPGERMLRVTPKQLKMQNGRKGRDAWTVYQGKVYNISPYVPFHPGGAGEILRGSGKDSYKLFMEVHPWVNWDGMLSECLVGILVGEDEQTDGTNGTLDEMD